MDNSVGNECLVYCLASSIEIGFVVIMDWRINGRFRREEFVEMGSIYSLLYSFGGFSKIALGFWHNLQISSLVFRFEYHFDGWVLSHIVLV